MRKATPQCEHSGPQTSFTATALPGAVANDVAESDSRHFGSTTRIGTAAVKKLFQPTGKTWLEQVQLPSAPDQPLLEQDLEVAELLEAKIKQLDGEIGQSQSEEEKLLESIPGIGPLFSSVIASEIDGIGRFNSSAKLAAYVGVVPTTHVSGGRVFQRAAAVAMQ